MPKRTARLRPYFRRVLEERKAEIAQFNYRVWPVGQWR